MEVREPAAAFATSLLSAPHKSCKSCQFGEKQLCDAHVSCGEPLLSSYYMKTGNRNSEKTSMCFLRVHLAIMAFCILISGHDPLQNSIVNRAKKLWGCCCAFLAYQLAQDLHSCCACPLFVMDQWQCSRTCSFKPYVACLIINKIPSSFADSSQSCQDR